MQRKRYHFVIKYIDIKIFTALETSLRVTAFAISNLLRELNIIQTVDQPRIKPERKRGIEVKNRNKGIVCSPVRGDGRRYRKADPPCNRNQVLALRKPIKTIRTDRLSQRLRIARRLKFKGYQKSRLEVSRDSVHVR